MSQSAQKIKLLPDDLTNKIAAGEVVERPASVVKELLENSIDAGADEVTIVVKDGGRSLIQVVDNGYGMNRDDAQMAFQRHATSKIMKHEDLEAIRTLGFRGEALASIASVSQIVLRTMEQGAAEATVVELEGGIETDLRISAGTSGTSVSVKNLFFNTPGRRKFVKSATTEYRKILEVINRVAICYPEIEFTFVHNDEIILETPKVETLEDRIITLYGNRLQDQLISIYDKGSACEISGVVGKQSTVRKQRGEQFLYLNKRYISDRSLNHAVISSYAEMLAHGGFPFYAIMLQIDPTRVDVNVHPTKMEVKFADDRLIYAILRNTVRQALSSSAVIPKEVDVTHSIPTVSFPPPYETTGASPQQSSQQAGTMPVTPPPDFRTKHPGRQIGLGLSHRPPKSDETTEPIEIIDPEEEKEPVFERTNVWQVHNRYILSQIKSGLVVIDQHVAHERVLFEQALESFSKDDPSSQRLLFPIVVELSAQDYDIATEILPFLSKLGFMLKPFGRKTLMMEGVPPGTRYSKGTQDSKIILHIIDEYKRGKHEKLEIRENIAASFACHSAIRSGDRLTRASMNALIDQLFATKSPYFCPHGRPVIINIPIEELDKRFGRV